MPSKTIVLRPADAGLAVLAPALEDAKQFASAAIPANTKRAYAADWADFEEWCRSAGESPLPARPQAVAGYISILARTHKASTIRRRLAAISKAHSMRGHANPCGVEAVKTTMKGIEATIGTRVGGKSPVTYAALEKMILSYGDSNTLETVRARALLLIGYAGAFRRSELCSLTRADVTWHPEGAVILLRKSKTDQRGEGYQKAIPYVNGPMCAARALHIWMQCIPAEQNQPVFCAFTRDGLPGKRALSPQTVALIVKGAATNAGLDPAMFSGHSLRSGHVTEARARGVADSATMQTTGHKRVETLEMYDRRNNPFSKGSAAEVLKGR